MASDETVQERAKPPTLNPPPAISLHSERPISCCEMVKVGTALPPKTGHTFTRPTPDRTEATIMHHMQFDMLDLLHKVNAAARDQNEDLRNSYFSVEQVSKLLSNSEELSLQFDTKMSVASLQDEQEHLAVWTCAEAVTWRS